MPALRVIEGGRGACYVRVRLDEHEELHVELTVARAERLVLDDRLRGHARSALRLIRAHPAAAALYVEEIGRLAERDALRALAMAAPCACGLRGPGHGPMDEDVLAVPDEVVA